MEISVENNQDIQVSLHDQKINLHPVWLRERIKGEQFIDTDSHQRLYEPSSIQLNLKIKLASIEDRILNVDFDDGISTQYNLDELLLEIDKENLKKDIFLKWNY